MMPADLAPAPFIVGVGRSGTTLLRLMLDAHPDLAIPAETHFLPALFKLDVSNSAAGMLKAITNAPTWPNMAMPAEALAEALAVLSPPSPAAAARAFFRLYAERHGKSLWGDKTPPYRSAMPQIAAALPEARFVHLIRDGRDVALSYRGLWFGPGDDIESQAAFWVREVERTRAAGRHVHYREVRYEDLVQSPAETLAGLCDWLGLRFEPGMLAYHRRAGARLAEYVRPFGPQGADRVPLDRFIGIHDHTAQAPDPGRIGRWRREMTAAECTRFEEIGGPLLKSLGYGIAG